MWFAIAGLGALVISRRRPDLRLPVLGAYLVTAVATAGVLGVHHVPRPTVDEDVVTGPARAAGSFESLAHTTTGKRAWWGTS